MAGWVVPHAVADKHLHILSYNWENVSAHLINMSLAKPTAGQNSESLFLLTEESPFARIPSPDSKQLILGRDEGRRP